VTYNELTRKLRRLGVEFRRNARGSHEIWWRPDRKLYTLIANHGSHEMSSRVVRKILADLELTQDQLRDA
jgi:predicted RNA binding protein YcfA (HicA-like mRNA interferase family)